MGSPHRSYLQECSDLHAALTENMYGAAQDLRAVEQAVQKAKSRRLRFDDISEIIDSPQFQAGRRFWAWPDRAAIERGLAEQPLDLWNLPRNERKVLIGLRAVFKTVDAASVILRFVDPQNYGILSGPVENVLGIQPSATAVDRYLNYVRDLRRIRDHYEFATAAAADQALWTLHVGAYRGFLPKHVERAYAADRFLRAIRLKNIAFALFERASKLDVADAVADYDPKLAGELAALEFERAVRRILKMSSGEDLGPTVISRAPKDGKGDWMWCVQRRNDAVHGRKILAAREIGKLIETTRTIVAESASK